MGSNATAVLAIWVTLPAHPARPAAACRHISPPALAAAPMLRLTLPPAIFPPNRLTALAASGLEWSPTSHKRWPPAIQEAVEVAFGPDICRPVCKRAARPATSARWPVAVQATVAAVLGPSPKPAGAPPAAAVTKEAAARSASAAGDAPRSQPANSTQPPAALQQLPAEIQERIGSLIVRPVSRWLLLPGGTLGETRVPSY